MQFLLFVLFFSPCNLSIPYVLCTFCTPCALCCGVAVVLSRVPKKWKKLKKLSIGPEWDRKNNLKVNCFKVNCLRLICCWLLMSIMWWGRVENREKKKDKKENTKVLGRACWGYKFRVFFTNFEFLFWVFLFAFRFLDRIRIHWHYFDYIDTFLVTLTFF